MSSTPALTPEQFTTFGELLKFLRDKHGFWVLVEPLRSGAR